MAAVQHALFLLILCMAGEVTNMSALVTPRFLLCFFAVCPFLSLWRNVIARVIHLLASFLMRCGRLRIPTACEPCGTA
jgi:hypothetical protein